MRQRRRVLLIEADPGDRDRVAAYLERTDYALQSAEGGALGLRLATAEPPDLILVDLSLPDLDGSQVCRRLREEPRTQTVPVIIVTASTDLALHRQVYAAGAEDCLPKPVSRQTLLATLDGVLASQRRFPRVPQFPGRALRGVVRNLSRGGLLAEFPVELVLGSRVDLTLETPPGASPRDGPGGLGDRLRGRGPARDWLPAAQGAELPPGAAFRRERRRQPDRSMTADPADPMERFLAWLLRRDAQAVDAGVVPADLLAEPQAEIEAAKERPQNEGHAAAIRQIADLAGVDPEKAAEVWSPRRPSPQ
jgi:CheY-like chemotaxis protein